MKPDAAPETPTSARLPDPEIEAAIAEMLTAPTARLATARRRLAGLPQPNVTHALISALDRQTSWMGYGRIASALASCGTDEAFAVLERKAHERNGRPRQIIRALERARTPECDAALIKLLASRSLSILRSAAGALVRRRVGAAIRPICIAAMQRGQRPDRGMVATLRRMGDPSKLVRMSLEVPDASTADHLAAIDALVAIPEIGRRLNAQRVLDRMTTERGALGGVAAAASRAYRDRATLLRPTERVADTTLVRPVGGPQPGASDQLVRPSTEPNEPERPVSGVRALWERLRDALQGD